MQTPPHPAELIECNPEFRSICRKLTGNHDLQADLYQEAILVICELNDDKIDHFARNPIELRWFFYVVCRNLWYQKSGTFFDKFRKEANNYYEVHIDVILSGSCINDYDQLSREADNDAAGIHTENRHKHLFKKIPIEQPIVDTYDHATLQRFIDQEKKEHDAKGKFPFDATVLEFYLQYGSTRKLQKLTTIPHTTFHLSIKRSKKKLQHLHRNGLI